MLPAKTYNSVLRIIVKELVQVHGETMEAQTTLGHGSTCTVHFSLGVILDLPK